MLLLCLLATFVMQAQQLDPVKWKYTVKETSATEAELVFTAKLDAGWHLYSQYTDPNGPLAIEFTFAESGDYARMGKVQEPKPHEEMDDIFNCVVKSFSGTVVFRQKVKRIDLLVSSRTDADYSGGLAVLVTNFPAKTVWASAEPEGAFASALSTAGSTAATPSGSPSTVDAVSGVKLIKTVPSDVSVTGSDPVMSRGASRLNPALFPVTPSKASFAFSRTFPSSKESTEY